MTFSDAVQILAAFERHGVAYVLVGSLAMAAQGIVRATRDMDVFVDPEEANVARLRAALDEVFRDPGVARRSAPVVWNQHLDLARCHVARGVPALERDRVGAPQSRSRSLGAQSH